MKKAKQEGNMNTIGWKVVGRAGNGDFQSARMCADWGLAKNLEWCVLYVVGRRTTGHLGTPVLAFRTRAAARSFKNDEDRVFQARLENPRPITHVAPWLSPESFVSFWKHPLQWQRRSLHAPDGTLACDAITLLEPA